MFAPIQLTKCVPTGVRQLGLSADCFADGRQLDRTMAQVASVVSNIRAVNESQTALPSYSPIVPNLRDKKTVAAH